MKTGIPGSGLVLAKAFLNEGYEVMPVTRNIENPEVGFLRNQRTYAFKLLKK